MSVESLIRQLFGFEGFAAVRTVADAARLALDVGELAADPAQVPPASPLR